MADEAANSEGKSYTRSYHSRSSSCGALKKVRGKPDSRVADIDEGTMIIRSHGVGPAIYAETQKKRILWCYYVLM